jgi:Ulp1 family protease
MVTKKEVYAQRHVWSFLSHEKILGPVRKHGIHWLLFVICPANRQINIIDSLYDQGSCHVKMFDNIAKLIEKYEK